MRNIEFCLDYLIVASKSEEDRKKREEESAARGSMDQAAFEAQ